MYNETVNYIIQIDEKTDRYDFKYAQKYSVKREVKFGISISLI